jgi:putative FmdB family regulatory protein
MGTVGRCVLSNSEDLVMPIYTYMCANCGTKDIKQSILEPRLDRCPDCNTTAFRKIIGSAGISFKGSGFYSTDNRGK